MRAQLAALQPCRPARCSRRPPATPFWSLRLPVPMTSASRPGAAMPAVGCSAPPCLLAVPRFR
eukprot:13091071-Alexandrium_andersonii.AAC.1